MVDGDGLLGFLWGEVGGGVSDPVLGGAPGGEAGALELDLLRRRVGKVEVEGGEEEEEEGGEEEEEKAEEGLRLHHLQTEDRASTLEV